MGASSPVGARLRDARRHLRLSQTAAATFANTTRQTIAAIEHGSRSPDLTELVALANLYRHSLDDLMSSKRFALRAAGAVAPAYHARFNSLTKASIEDPEDRAELESFVDYLSTRTARGPRLRYRRELFEPISRTAQGLLDAWRPKRAEPHVPVFELMSALGIEVRFTALGKLAGALIRGTDDQPPGILINSDQPYDRQRFSAAHEIGHLVLDHKTEDPAFVSLLGRRFDAIEVQADQFAAELLIPERRLLEALKDVSSSVPHVPARVRHLARTFIVSYQAMTQRLERLGALTPDELDEVQRTKPSQIDAGSSTEKGGARRKFSEAILRSVWPSVVTPKSVVTADTVRLLQENAFDAYRTTVPEGERVDAASDVYEHVALWVARHHPIVQG